MLLLAVNLAVGIGVIVFFSTTNSQLPLNCAEPATSLPGGVTVAPGVSTLATCERLARTTNSCLTLPAHCTPDAPDGDGLTTTPATPQLQYIPLPTDVIPNHYNLELKPDFYSDNFLLHGKVQISLTCSVATNKIILHASELSIDRNSITVISTADPLDSYRAVILPSDTDRLVLILDEYLTAGSNYVLSIDYTAPLTKDSKGMYLYSYIHHAEYVWGVATDLNPSGARKMFPCFDEPQMTATFNVTVLRKLSKASYSNWPVTKTITQNDWIYDVHENNEHRIATYQLAVVVGQFQMRTTTSARGKQIRVLARDNIIAETDRALTMTKTYVDFFDEYFGIEFPFPGLDIIWLPDLLKDSVANSGLIFYREDIFKVANSQTSLDQQMFISSLFARQVAHMWFGGLVSIDWWDDVWMNDGLAYYLSFLTMMDNNSSPRWAMMDDLVVSGTITILAADSGVSSHPIYSDINDPDTIDQQFDDISIKKGAAIFRMLHSFLGDSIFQGGLYSYLIAHKQHTAGHKELWEAFTEQLANNGIQLDVERVMGPWIKQLGYPVVYMRREGAQVIATQEHFILTSTDDTGELPNSPYQYKWYVPLTVTSKPDFEWNSTDVTWMNMDNVTVTLPSNAEWYIANLGKRGYYRVHYDQDNFQKIVMQLIENHMVIAIADRAQLIDDTLQLSRGEIGSIVDALKVVQYLINETDYLPWISSQMTFDLLDNYLIQSEYHPDFQFFLQTLAKKQYDRLGWFSQDDGNNLFRALMVRYSCDTNSVNCIRNAVNELKKLKANPDTYKVDEINEETVYRMNIKHGDRQEWTFLLSQLLKWDSTHTLALINGLCQTSSVSYVTRMLNMAMNETIPSKYFASTLYFCSTSSIGNIATWNFIKLNFDRLLPKFNAMPYALFRQVMERSIGARTTILDLQDAKAFKEAHAYSTRVRETFTKIIEDIAIAIDWLRKNEHITGEWLRAVNQLNDDNQRRR